MKLCYLNAISAAFRVFYQQKFCEVDVQILYRCPVLCLPPFHPSSCLVEDETFSLLFSVKLLGPSVTTLGGEGLDPGPEKDLQDAGCRRGGGREGECPKHKSWPQIPPSNLIPPVRGKGARDIWRKEGRASVLTRPPPPTIGAFPPPCPPSPHLFPAGSKKCRPTVIFRQLNV